MTNATCAVMGTLMAAVYAATPAWAADQVYSFGSRAQGSGQHVTPSMKFDAKQGFGFESIDGLHDSAGYFTSDRPFAFSVAEPDGNYDVAVSLTGEAGSCVTIKAEDRRLMAEKITPAPGQTAVVHFTVNVRTAAIASGGHVRLKSREVLTRDWDDKLTLAFTGTKPCVSEIDIEPAPDATTVFLAGDSTVTDQPSEPYNSWGQMLPRFFKPGVAVANHAVSGGTLKSFIGEQRLAKVLSVLKPGDYLFIQFGHNDQKDKSADAGAFKSYTANLKKLITAAREHEAHPVLITPVSRRIYKDGMITNSLGDFPEAVRQLAKADNVPLIDLNASSAIFYDALGPSVAPRAFAPKDPTHHDDYGSYEIAKCVVDGIIADHLELANKIVDDFTTFDPAHPDPIDAFDLPADPKPPHVAKPEGS